MFRDDLIGSQKKNDKQTDSKLWFLFEAIGQQINGPRRQKPCLQGF